MVVNIGFGTLNVNAQRRDASISIGESNQSTWSAHSKRNFGYGMPFGMNTQFNIVNHISDVDGVDSPINDMDFSGSFENQTG